MGIATHQAVTDESVTFAGREPEEMRPKAPCPSCREALKREAATYGPSGRRSRLLCFDCCRADLERTRAFKAAGELDTASEARFQSQLPFESVNRSHLGMLKAERSESRVAASRGIGRYVDKQRHAQIEARHALRAIAASLNDRQLAPAVQVQAMALGHPRRVAAARRAAAVRGVAMSRPLIDHDERPSARRTSTGRR